MSKRGRWSPFVAALALALAAAGGCGSDGEGGGADVRVDVAPPADMGSGPGDTGVGGPDAALADTGSGPADTGAGGPDAASGDTGGGTWTPSPELARVLAELEKARAGQPADLDGDGAADWERVADAGAVTYRFDEDEDGTPEVEIVVAADGGSTTTVDVDEDGRPEKEEVFTADGTRPVKVVREDTDGDGVFERRTTLQYDYEAGTLTYTIEADPDGDGTFVVERVVEDTHERHAGDGCDGSAGMPDLDDGPVQEFPGRHIRVAVGAGAGRCDATWGPKVAAAVDCAINRAVICLASNHPEYAAKLAAALDGENVKDLAIGCGNTCADTFASTKSFERPWFGDSTMNINPTEFGALDDWGQCGLMLHELIHWSGDEGPPEHNDDTLGGDDAIYSCGRYCGKCGDWGKNAPGNSSIDCARCAQGTDRKLACGAKEEWDTWSCAEDAYAVCHQGLACLLKPCDECGGLRKKTCDDRQTDEKTYDCCVQCPSDCNGSNDNPCGGALPGTDNCTETSPPFCR